MSPQRKRLLLVGGAVVLALAAYLFLRGRSSGQSSGAAGTAGAAGQAAPAAASDGSGGAASPDASALLAALAGENQDLLRGFLNSTNGLVSLAGSSVGSTTAGQVSEAAPGSFSSTPLASSTPVASSSATGPITYADLGVAPAPITQAMVAPPLPEPQVTQPAPQTLGGGPLDVPTAQISTDVGFVAQTAPSTDYGFLSDIGSGAPAPVSSGAAAVASGQTKVNYQARRQL